MEIKNILIKMRDWISPYWNYHKEYLHLILVKVIHIFNLLKKKIYQKGGKLLGPIEKGFKKAKLLAPPVGVYEGVDLKILPKYIAYQAALKREKVTLYFVLSFFTMIFAIYFMTTQIQISTLTAKLREKEFILAPGVMDFTKASPQLIPENYVKDAAMDFLSKLGNFSSENIEEQFESLKRFMSHELKVQFSINTSDWVEQVKEDNISQILKINEKEVVSNNEGLYRVIALGRADLYSEQQYLGHEDQVIKMVMKLVPPARGKRWFLQIVSLSWEKAETFRKKSKLENKKDSK